MIDLQKTVQLRWRIRKVDGNFRCDHSQRTNCFPNLWNCRQYLFSSKGNISFENSSIMKHFVCIMVLAGLFLTLPRECVAYSIMLKGYIKGEFYQQGMDIVDEETSKENDFTIRVGHDGQFNIIMERPRRGNYSINQYSDKKVEAGFDGMDLYSIHHRKNVKDGYASSGSFPCQLTYNARVLWLVFCSSGYLNDMRSSGEKEIPLVWRNAQHDLRAYGFRIDYLLTEGNIQFLKSAEFFRSANLDLPFKEELKRPLVVPVYNWKSRSDFKGDLKSRREFWPDGYHVASLKTLSDTNLYGLQIPVKIELDVRQGDKDKIAAHYPNPKQAHISKHHALFQISISSITKQVKSDRSFLPKINKTNEFMVMDIRFRKKGNTKSIDGISYSLSHTNFSPYNNWVPYDSPVLAESAAMKLKNFSIANPIYTLVKRIFIYLFMAFVVAAFIGFAIRRHQTKKES